MVEIFTGAGAGRFNSSISELGAFGRFGSAVYGRGGENISVNAATGNLILSRQDEFLIGRGLNVSAGRSYNSIPGLPNPNDPNGGSWTLFSIRRITGTFGDAEITLNQGDGSHTAYRREGNRYVSNAGAGAHDYIVRNAANTAWVLTDPDSNITETYLDSLGGRISSREHPNDRSLRFVYDSQSRLDYVETDDGARVNYNWTDSQLDGIWAQDSSGATQQRTRYSFDSQGRIDGVTIDLSPGDRSDSDGDIYEIAYTYFGTTNQIKTITQTGGQEVAFTYDGQGRVKSIDQLVDGSNRRLTTLTYASGYTVVEDPTGLETRLYHTDGQLDRVEMGDQSNPATLQVNVFSYDGDGNVTRIVDAEGNVTAFTYNASGTLATSTDAKGILTTYSYDAFNNRIATRTTADTQDGEREIGAFQVFDENQRLRFSIDSDGGVTEMRYAASDAAGIKKGDLQYVIAHTSDTPYSFQRHIDDGSNPTIGQLRYWSGRQDASGARVTEYTYGLGGQVAESIEWSRATSAGLPDRSSDNARMQYAYDMSGNLLETQRNGENAASFAYDGLNRAIRTQGKGGGVVSIDFQDAALKTVVTTAGQHTRTSVYNKAGDLLTETGAASKRNGSYTYDDAGRVRLITDPANSRYRQYFIYDEFSRVVAESNYYGDVTEYVYDDLDRVIHSRSYRYRMTADQKTDLFSLREDITIDDIRPKNKQGDYNLNSRDLSEWTVYDERGQVARNVLGDGSVIDYTYDDAGRLTKTYSFYNKLTSAQVKNLWQNPENASNFTPTARSSYDQVARTFYDKAGRVIGALNGEGNVSQNVYDSSGQLIETVSYEKSASSSLRASGTFSQLVSNVSRQNGNDIHTRFVYNGQGQLRYQIDGVGRVVESVYSGGDDGDAYQLREVIAHADALGDLTAAGGYGYANVEAKVSALGNASDVRTQYSVFDDAGRIAYSVSADGSVVGYEYNNRDLVTKQTAFAKTFVANGYPSEAELDVWAQSNAQDARIQRSFYNRYDLKVIDVDGEGYVTEYTYQDDGQVRNINRYETALTDGEAESLTASAFTAMRNAGDLGELVNQHFSYDYAGRLSSVWAADNSNGYKSGDVRTVTSYSGTGLVSRQVENYGGLDARTTLFYQDAAGRASLEYHYAGNYAISAERSERSEIRTYYNGTGQVSLVRTTGTGSFTEIQQKGDRNALQRDNRFYYDRAGRVRLEVSDQAEDGSILQSRKRYYYDGHGFSTETRSDRFLTSQLPETNTNLNRDFRRDDLENQARTFTYYNAAGQAELIVTEAELRSIGGGKFERVSYATSQTYNAFGEVERVTRHSTPLKNVAANTRPSVVNAPSDSVQTFQYDSLGRVTSVTDAENNVELTEYNAFGQVSKTTNAAGAETTYAYDERGLLESETTQMRVKTESGFVETVTTRYEYDHRGNLLKTFLADNIGSQRRIVENTYDARDRLVSTSGGPEGTMSYRYDERNNMVEHTDGNGDKTVFFYDRMGRQTDIISAEGTHTHHIYDPNGDLRETRVATDAITSLPVDPYGEPPVQSGSYRATKFEYDLRGRMTKSIVENVLTVGFDGTNVSTGQSDLTTTYTYDAMDNIVSMTDPNGNSEYTWYDVLGRKTAHQDTAGYISRWEYNHLNLVTKEVRHSERSTAASVDLFKPPANVSEDGDRVTVYTYDENGNRLTETRMGVVYQTVDGQDSAPTDATVTYTYNALNQVETREEATGETTTFVYDNTGRLTAEIKPIGTYFNGTSLASRAPEVQFEYDAHGNLVTTRQKGFGAFGDRVTEQDYLSNGRLEATRDAENNVRLFEYDDAGRVTREIYFREARAGGADLTESIRYTYDGEGRTTSQTLQVLTSGSVAYSGGQIQYSGTVSWNNANADRTETRFNVFGEIEEIKLNGVVTETFAYDKAGRVIRSTAGDGIAKFYFHDANGNQTVAIQSSGANLQALDREDLFGTAAGKAWDSIAAVDTEAARTGVVATLTRFSARNESVEIVAPQREINGGVKQSIETAMRYNAFGEVVETTDSLGNVTRMDYNTMGRLVATHRDGADIVLETGVEQNNRTVTDRMFYDLSGRNIGMADANGNRTRYTLQAGTGYGGSQGMILETRYDDLSAVYTDYNVHGDMVRELKGRSYADGNLTQRNTHRSEAIANKHVTQYGHDKLGRVVQVTHGDGLKETYVLDSLGQRLKTTYNHESTYGLGRQGRNGAVAKTLSTTTEYDSMGRILKQVGLGGSDYTTTYSYQFNANTTTLGLGTFGGWTKTTTLPNSYFSTETTDAFGRRVGSQLLWRNGLPTAERRNVSFRYDAAGRLVSETGSGTENRDYTYYNTGQIRGITETSTTRDSVTNESRTVTKTASYTYDELGRLKTDKISFSGSQINTRGRVEISRYKDAGSRTLFGTYRDATLEYDALGRLVKWSDNATNAPKATRKFSYDAAGNVRNSKAWYQIVNENKTFGAVPNINGLPSVDYWYAYDEMNRVLIAEGKLEGTDLKTGSVGALITYDELGRRKTVQRGGNLGIVGTFTEEFEIVGPRTVSESGNNTYTYTLKRSTTANDVEYSVRVIVDPSVIGGNAADNGDIELVSSSVQFLKGEDEATFQLRVVDDTLPEMSEYFKLEVYDPVTGETQIITNSDLFEIEANDSAVGSGLIAIDETTLSVTEGGFVDVEISRSFNTGEERLATTIYYELVAGTAGTADYRALNGSYTFEANATAPEDGRFRIRTIDDSVYEGDETFEFVITGVSGDARLGASKATITIEDDELPPGSGVFALASNVTVDEGGTATFTVNRTGDTSVPTTLQYRTVGLTATQDVDFERSTGTLSFAANEASRTITVRTLQDAIWEGAETFRVEIFNASGGSISTASRTGTIRASDVPPGSGTFSVDPVAVSVQEGGIAQIVVTRELVPSDPRVPTTVYFRTIAGTAGANDYVATSNGSIVFGATETSKVIQVQTKQDGVYEGNETFQVQLTSVSGGQIKSIILGGGDEPEIPFEPEPIEEIFFDTANVIITDDDPEASGTFSVAAPVTVDEGQPAQFVISRSGDLSVPTTIRVRTVNITAFAGSDYQAVNRDVTFAAGQSSATVTVSTINDTLYENAETFRLEIVSVGQGASIGTKSAIGTIRANDVPAGSGTFSIPLEGITVSEGGVANITVTRELSPSDPRVETRVFYRTVEGTATNADYTAVSNGVIVFGANETSKVISIQTTNDDIYELVERFAVELTGVSGGVIKSETFGGSDDPFEPDPGFTIVYNRTEVSIAANDVPGGSGVFNIASNVTVNEGANATFTVSRTGDLRFATSVSYTTANGSAVAGSDYTANSGTINFAAGQATATITVRTINDTVYEGAETFTLRLTGVSGGSLGTNAVRTGTIRASDVPAGSGSFSVASNVTVDEGQGATFRITRTGDASFATTVNFRTVGITAQAGSDFTARTGSVTFAAGETSKDITVQTINDAVYEQAETFRFEITSVSGGSIGTASRIATIRASDVPAGSGTFSIPLEPVNVVEGGVARITVTRELSPSDPRVPTTVYYRTVAGTAGASDYTAVSSGAITFAANETSKTISINITDDAIYEGQETFNVQLTGVSGGSIKTETFGGGDDPFEPEPEFTLTYDTTGIIIAESDIPGGSGTFNIAGNVTVNEGSPAVFTVTRTGDARFATTVNYTTLNGTATAGSDYTARSGSVTFAAGQTSATITVQTIDDSAYEGAETFSLRLTGTSGGALGTTATRTATIRASDTPAGSGSFSVASNVTVNEGSNAVFRIDRTGDTRFATSVTYRTVAGSATAGSDFRSLNGTITFAAGQTSATVSVQTFDDSIYEGAETFQFQLLSVSGGTIGTSTRTATINASDVPSGSGTFSVPQSAVTVTEGGVAQITVTRSLTPSDPRVPTTVYYRTNTGTAGTSDYASVSSGSITFGANETSKVITVQTTDDSVYEGTETFSVQLTGVSGGEIAYIDIGGGDDPFEPEPFERIYLDTTVVRISDNDVRPGSGTFSVASNVTVNEGQTATFRINRTGDLSVATTVNYRTNTGSASSSDFTGVNGSITFAAGQTFANVNVVTTDDSLEEGAETFTFEIVSVSGGSIGTKTRTGTIRASDVPVSGSGSFTVNDAGTVEEGFEHYFVIRRSGDLSAVTTVNYRTVDGTARAGEDFFGETGSVVFGVGDDTKVVAIVTIFDNVYESNEFYTLNITSVSGGSVSDGSGTGTIRDADFGGPDGPEIPFVKDAQDVPFASASKDHDVTKGPVEEIPSNITDAPDDDGYFAFNEREFEPVERREVLGETETYNYVAGTDRISDVTRTQRVRTILEFNGEVIFEDESTQTAGRSEFVYDGFGRQVRQTDLDASGNRIYTKASVYDTMGHLISENTVSRLSGKLSFTYNRHYYHGELYLTNQGGTERTVGGGGMINYAMGQASLTWTDNFVDENRDGTTSVGQKDEYKGTSATQTVYEYRNSAVTSRIRHFIDVGDASFIDFIDRFENDGNINITFNTLNESGRLIHSRIEDKRDRIVSFDHDLGGLVIRRDELDHLKDESDPLNFFLRVGLPGATRELGKISNDTPEKGARPGGDGYEKSLKTRQRTSDNYAFTKGAKTGSPYADFSSGVMHYNSYFQGAEAGAGANDYIASGGETLSSIAQQVYGDSSLWYKVAQANGLQGDQALIAGQSLKLPGGVARNTFNADSLTPYDPSEGTGDISPTNAKPGKNKKCGVFGAILIAVVAVAVTLATAGAAAAALTPGLTALQGIGAAFGVGASGLAGVGAAGAIAAGTATGAIGTGTLIAAGAIGGAVGSIASQGLGIALGHQESFSWKSVALGAVSGAVGGGLSGVGRATELGGSAFLNGASKAGKALNSVISSPVGSAIVGNVATQGIAMVTGLQSKFDWVGVAASAAGAAAGSLSKGLAGRIGHGIVDAVGIGGDIGTRIAGGLAEGVRTAASALASAATRTAIDGSSFGQNIIAAIPDVVANALKGAVGACFTGETPVHTSTGLKRIDEIKVGDWVYSRDEHFEDDTVELKQVIELYRFEDRATLDVVIEFEDGHEEVLRTTPEHPFAVDVGAERYDEDLEAGRILNAGTISIAKSHAHALHAEAVSQGQTLTGTDKVKTVDFEES